MIVTKVSAADWAVLSEKAHLLAFEEHKPADWDRIDFALTVQDGGEPCGYVTCRELDPKTLYWAFGGAFPGTRASARAYRGYQAMIRWTKEAGYERIATYIENTNTPMLKMAMKVGYVITGVRMFKGSVLLEHLLEFSRDQKIEIME